jgi:hypothetical protein
MELKNYIFLSTERTTSQLNSGSVEPDIENLKVISFAKGKDSKEANRSLISENEYWLNTTLK